MISSCCKPSPPLNWRSEASSVFSSKSFSRVGIFADLDIAHSRVRLRLGRFARRSDRRSRSAIEAPSQLRSSPAYRPSLSRSCCWRLHIAPDCEVFAGSTGYWRPRLRVRRPLPNASGCPRWFGQRRTCREWAVESGPRPSECAVSARTSGTKRGTSVLARRSCPAGLALRTVFHGGE